MESDVDLLLLSVTNHSESPLLKKKVEVGISGGRSWVVFS